MGSSELSQYIKELDCDNNIFEEVDEETLKSDKFQEGVEKLLNMENRYNITSTLCDDCIKLQEELLISTNHACGQIVCTCEPDTYDVDFNLDSVWTTNLTCEENENSNTPFVVDLTNTPPRRNKR